MRSGEAYRTVAEVAADSGCWETFVFVTGKPVEEQVAWLEKVFFAAACRHDDKGAARYVGFICQALDDGQFMPLLKEGRGRRVLSNDWQAVEQAGARAQQARAEKMMELYPQLPAHGTGDARELLTENESRPIKVDAPTLLETRRAMLTEVAIRWRLTKDEEEAARLFRFLQSLELRFDAEKKMFREVLYKATDASFPPQRLVGALLALAPSGDLNLDWGDQLELGRILAIAWARNSDLSLVARQLRTVQPLPGCSNTAFEFVEGFARGIAELDVNTQKLKEAMQEGGRRIYGEITFSYSRSGASWVVECAIAQRLDSLAKFDDNQGHEIFEQAKRFVRQWQDTNRHTVNLRLSVSHPYDKEPRFKRELYLGVPAAV